MRRCLSVILLVVAVGSCGGGKKAGRSFHALPPLGARLLVLAPHPDDEVLGAAGMIEAAVRRGADVRVVVATDGEAGPDRLRAGSDLPRERRDETRHALADLGVGAAAITFLGYADGSLAGAWSERWAARKRNEGRGSADEIVADLRDALHAAPPDSVVLPMPVDRHPDHAALNRFALLAILAEFSEEPEPALFGYLIHGGRQWPESGRDPVASESPPEGCAGSLFPWTAVVLDGPGVQRKASLIAQYRSQVASGSRLFRYAGRDEPFATGQVIHGPRSMSPTFPGLRRTGQSIAIRVPRGECTVEPGRRDRLRLRFIRAGQIEERLIQFPGGVPNTRGGTLGQSLVTERDVTVTTGTRSVRLALALDAFRDIPGAVLEVLPQSPERVGPAWLLRWRGANLRVGGFISRLLTGRFDPGRPFSSKYPASALAPSAQPHDDGRATTLPRAANAPLRVNVEWPPRRGSPGSLPLGTERTRRATRDPGPRRGERCCS